ncbi:PD-(D/E)XK nuclease family protein [Natronolimnobius baerhuensis]|uniref:PD-(D/E)XK endonuclease-like domain-containing protein n=1 Tax=Natronolimnobius baerhuensis TaxID=253108 RepID=A0A202E8X0_9EURY|nr:PD-(D/E)XK nuclease family protein [Natronolimnobius baerhuensis]OVE84715.1 hypothetical protein B2G88_10040 [Natronolimnobius baerhuensis]
MTENADSDEDGTTPATLSADGLRTYLHCPRRYEFAHVHGFDDSDDDGPDERVALLRRALCTTLEQTAQQTGEIDRETLADRALEALATRWERHDERFHSRAQRRHERQVLEATVEAYVEAVGPTHAAGLRQLLAATDKEADPLADLVGPDLTLSSSVSFGEQLQETATLEATVDYVYGDGSSVVGVRFVPSVRPLGFLRYRDDWERVAESFVDHFDPEMETFDPDPIGALFETSVVLAGLRSLCDRLGLEDRTCRYVQIPLADREHTSVNWVRETVETSLEPVDLTDAYVDHHTFGMTLEHRNTTVDSRLESLASRLVSGAFDPSDRWDRIASESCPDCAYTACCQEYIAEEVRFDG